MKQFIVFLAMLIVFSSALVFTTDSNNYVRLQKHLKALAEEAASGAILLMDEDETMRSGKYVINMEAAQKYVAHIVEDRVFNANIFPLSFGTLSWTAELTEASVNPSSNAAIRVCVYWNGDGLFRNISFGTSVSQSAVYETRLR